MFVACGIMPAGSIVGSLYHKLQTQSSVPEDGRNYRPKHVELIEFINKLLLLHLVGCLYHCIYCYPIPGGHLWHPKLQAVSNRRDSAT